MDSVFEKELLKIQLFRLFDIYDDKQAREILINCINKDVFKPKTSEPKQTKIISQSSICNICESNFILQILKNYVDLVELFIEQYLTLQLIKLKRMNSLLLAVKIN